MSNVKERILPPALCWATETVGVSAVLVETNGADPTKVDRDFKESFEERWKEAERRAVEAAGAAANAKADGLFPTIEEGWRPNHPVEPVEGGLLYRFDPLVIPYPYDLCEVEAACDAVEGAFADVKRKNPKIEFHGAFSFPWSDHRCGDEEEFEFASEKGTKGDAKAYVWKAVEVAFRNDDEIAEKLAEEIEAADVDDVKELVTAIVDAELEGWLSEGAANAILVAVSDWLYEDGFFDGDDEDAMEIRELLRIDPNDEG